MVGSYGQDSSIDMIVVMPKSLFQDKDYLNLRYFHKRAYYLANLTASIKKELRGFIEVEFEHLAENELLPILVARKITKQGEKGAYSVRVIPCAPEKLFTIRKLLPTCNGIRPTDDIQHEDLPPTPFYNSTIVADMLFLDYLRLLHRTSEQCASFRDTCMLGRIWLCQRGIGSRISQGGFGHFEFAVITALLLRHGGGKKGEAIVSSSLPSVQLFKAVMRFLCVAEFLKKPYIFFPSKATLEAVPKEGPAIFDGERGHNVLYKMTPWAGALLRQHAKWTAAVFADEHAEQLTPLFISKADLPKQMYDLMFNVQRLEIDGSQYLDKKGCMWNAGEKVYKLLRKALGDRAVLICLNGQKRPRWKVDSGASTKKSAVLHVGVVFDAVNMSRKMDRGPPAEDKQRAVDFRQFWGSKSELRRFQDGSMSETVVWTESTAFGICQEIISHMAKMHLGISAQELHFAGSELPSIIHSSPADAKAFVSAWGHFNDFQNDIRRLEGLPLQVKHVSPIAPELRSTSLQLPPSSYNKDVSRALDVIVSFEASSKWPDNISAIQRAKVAFLSKIGALLEESRSYISVHLGLEDSPKDIENLAFLDVTYHSSITFRVRIHSELEEYLLEQKTKDKLAEKHIKTESAELLARLRRQCIALPLHTQLMAKFTTKFPALSSTVRLLKHWFGAHKLSNHFSEELVELFATSVFLQPYPWQAPASAGTGFLRILQYLARWDWRDEPLVVDFSGEMTSADMEDASTRLKAWRNIDPNLNRTVMFVATDRDLSGTTFTQLGPSKVVAARMTALARSACRFVRQTAGTDSLVSINKSVKIESTYWGPLDAKALFRPNFNEFDVVIKLSSQVVKNITSNMLSAELSGPTDAAKHRGKRRKIYRKDGRRDRVAEFEAVVEEAKAGSNDVRDGKAANPLPAHPVDTLVSRLNEAYGNVIIFFHGNEIGEGALDGKPNSQSRQLHAAIANVEHKTTEDITVLGVWNQQVRARTFRVNLPCSFMPFGASVDGNEDEEHEVDGDDTAELVEVNRTAILAEIARLGGDMIENIKVNNH